MAEPDDEQIKIDPGLSYFLYVGEAKTAGLSAFLTETLSRRYGKPAVCVHIVPDILHQYPPGPVMVVNRRAAELSRDLGCPVNFRTPAGEFAREAAEEPGVRSLVDEILEHQADLFINVFESRPELSLLEDRRLNVIGPEPQLARRLNSKFEQYRLATELGIRVPEGAVCGTLDDALRFAAPLIERDGRVFTSAEFSAAGANSIIARSTGDILEKFGARPGSLLVTRFVEHQLDPTVLGVVAGPGQVYIASVADQTIDGTRFQGSFYPTTAGPEKGRELVETTRRIGSHLGELGYRGTFGCDYMIDGEGRIFFVEINARKQGTTMETTLTMLHTLPDHPSFPELEFMAVTGQGLPAGAVEMDPGGGSLFWQTFNCKTDRDVTVTGSVGKQQPETELFGAAAAGRSGYTVLDHAGPGTRVLAGGFIGRVVAAGADAASVHSRIKEGVRLVKDTILPAGRTA